MNAKVQIHECSTPGLTMDQPRVQEVRNSMGQHYFKATAKLGSVFGAEVFGSDLEGIGRTREEALERLHNATVEFHESLWA